MKRVEKGREVVWDYLCLYFGLGQIKFSRTTRNVKPMSGCIYKKRMST